jgi:hypothetical protein
MVVEVEALIESLVGYFFRSQIELAVLGLTYLACTLHPLFHPRLLKSDSIPGLYINSFRMKSIVGSLDGIMFGETPSGPKAYIEIQRTRQI